MGKVNNQACILELALIGINIRVNWLNKECNMPAEVKRLLDLRAEIRQQILQIKQKNNRKGAKKMNEQKRKEKALLLRVDRLKNTINGNGRYKLYFLVGDILHIGLYSGYKVSQAQGEPGRPAMITYYYTKTNICKVSDLD